MAHLLTTAARILPEEDAPETHVPAAFKSEAAMELVWLLLALAFDDRGGLRDEALARRMHDVCVCVCSFVACWLACLLASAYVCMHDLFVVYASRCQQNRRACSRS